MTGVVCLALSVAAASLSWRTLSENVSAYGLLQAGARVTADGAGNVGIALAPEARRAADLASGPCRPALDRAASTVAIAELLTHDQRADYDGWLVSAAGAQSVLRHSLACAPGDGIAWARLALAERLVSASLARLDDLVLRSYRTAPADPVALASRIALLRSLPTTTPPGVEKVLRADVETVLGQAWPPEAAFLFRYPEPRLAKEIEEVLGDLTPARQHHLRAAGLLEQPPSPIPPGEGLGDTLARFLEGPPPR